MPMSYFVCATPRTGSSLLLGLLDATGVCGHPQAYFREPDESLWAQRWQLPPGWTRDGFTAAAIRAGSTPNGVFGAKLMWGAHDRAPIDGARFLHLRREDVLAQAVSWLRAEQTGTWFVGGHGEISGNSGGGEPHYPRPRHQRQSDTLNDEWIRRYQAASIAGS